MLKSYSVVITAVAIIFCLLYIDDSNDESIEVSDKIKIVKNTVIAPPYSIIRTRYKEKSFIENNNKIKRDTVYVNVSAPIDTAAILTLTDSSYFTSRRTGTDGYFSYEIFSSGFFPVDTLGILYEINYDKYVNKYYLPKYEIQFDKLRKKHLVYAAGGVGLGLLAKENPDLALTVALITLVSWKFKLF